MLELRNGQANVERYLVPYDIDECRKAFFDRGLSARGGAYTRAVMEEMETGNDTAYYFAKYAYKLARKEGYEDCKVVPNYIWRKAEKNWKWEKG